MSIHVNPIFLIIFHFMAKLFFEHVHSVYILVRRQKNEAPFFAFLANKTFATLLTKSALGKKANF